METSPHKSTKEITKLLAKGGWGRVEAVLLKNQTSPGEEFWNSLSGFKVKSSNAKTTFATLFQDMANFGNVSPKRFKTEMDGFCAFRIEFGGKQIRFPCFRDGKKWIITHGFFKPGATKGLGEWPESEELLAKKYRTLYFSEKQQQGQSEGTRK